jgi:hypothetical protein
MRIRTQITLSIFPLFLAIAVISGVLNYTTLWQEVGRGSDDAMHALATTLAAFVDGTTIATLTGDDEAARAARSELELEWGRLLREGTVGYGLDTGGTAEEIRYEPSKRQAEGIYILSPDATTVVFHCGESAGLGRNHTEVPDLLERMAEKKVVITAAGESSDRPITSGYAPIIGDDGSLAGILGVDVDSSYFQLRSRRIGLKVGAISGLTMFLGIAIAIMISGFISRPVLRLSRAARLIAGGAYSEDMDFGNLQEIRDLGGTFDTMSNVLDEILSKAKRFVIENEQFRTQADLARAYIDLVEVPRGAKAAGIEVSATHVGERPSGSFVRLVERPDHVAILICGRLAGEGQLDTVATAMAVSDYAGIETATTPPEEVLGKLSRLFEFVRLELLAWHTDAPVRRTVWDRSGGITTEDVVLGSDEVLVTHTVGEDQTEHARVCAHARLFSHLTTNEAVIEVARVLGGAADGVVVIMKRA